MSWVKVDDQMPRHPKFLELGRNRLVCQGVWLDGLCYASTYLTDGFVPEGALDRGANNVALLLVEVGLWERVAGGYRIHDYHEYQPSRVDVLSLRKQRAEAGRRGGQANGKQTASKTEAPRFDVAQAKPNPVPYPSRPVPVDVQTYIDPLVLYAERTGRKPGVKEQNWIEDLHGRFSRTELVKGMLAVPAGRDYLKRVDAYMEGAA